MGNIGTGLVCLGIVGLFAGAFWDVSADRNVVNLDLLAIRTSIFIVSGFSFLSGVILLATDYLRDSLREVRRAVSTKAAPPKSERPSATEIPLGTKELNAGPTKNWDILEQYDRDFSDAIGRLREHGEPCVTAFKRVYEAVNSRDQIAFIANKIIEDSENIEKGDGAPDFVERLLDSRIADIKKGDVRKLAGLLDVNISDKAGGFWVEKKDKSYGFAVLEKDRLFDRLLNRYREELQNEQDAKN